MAACTVTHKTERIERTRWDEISMKPNGDRNLDKAPVYLRTDEFRTSTETTIFLGPSYGPGGGGGGARFASKRSDSLKASLAGKMRKGEKAFLFPDKNADGNQDTQDGIRSSVIAASLKALGVKVDPRANFDQNPEARKSKARDKKSGNKKDFLKALQQSDIIITKSGHELKLISELMKRSSAFRPKKIIALNVAQESIPKNLARAGIVSIGLAASSGLPEGLRDKQGPLATLQATTGNFRASYKSEARTAALSEAKQESHREPRTSLRSGATLSDKNAPKASKRDDGAIKTSQDKAKTEHQTLESPITLPRSTSEPTSLRFATKIEQHNFDLAAISFGASLREPAEGRQAEAQLAA
ncbi:MAG: hypothetical protein KDD62_00485 [Bdellovibrionales bacterium]|nr:hypothetical protein [Bdellovibrionales bacterium]